MAITSLEREHIPFETDSVSSIRKYNIIVAISGTTTITAVFVRK